VPRIAAAHASQTVLAACSARDRACSARDRACSARIEPLAAHVPDRAHQAAGVQIELAAHASQTVSAHLQCPSRLRPRLQTVTEQLRCLIELAAPGCPRDHATCSAWIEPATPAFQTVPTPPAVPGSSRLRPSQTVPYARRASAGSVPK
jgi:hypothetical protein